LALTSPTGGGRSVGIVRSRTKATEFSFSLRRMQGDIINAHWSSRQVKSSPTTALERPRGFQEAEFPRFQDNRHMKVVSPTHRPPLPLGNVPDTYFR